MQKGKRGFSVRRIKGCRLTECGFQSVGFLRLESNGEDYRPDFTDSRGYFFVSPDSLTHEVVAPLRRYEPDHARFNYAIVRKGRITIPNSPESCFFGVVGGRLSAKFTEKFPAKRATFRPRDA